MIVDTSLDDSVAFDVDTARWFGPVTVPSLAPYKLQHVPGYTVDASGEEIPDWRPAWFDWRERALYAREKEHRLCRQDPEYAAGSKRMAQACPHFFKLFYGWIGEPRQQRGMVDDNPFIPFHFQFHLTNATMYLISLPYEQDMWKPKSRGLGVSWNNQTDEGWLWWATRFRCILSSRNEDLVADLENVDSMFGKIFYLWRMVKEHTPWIMPSGFDPDNPTRGKWWNGDKMRLTNQDKNSPGYRSQMVGAPTTKNVGRQGRYGLADVDEAQEMPKLNKVLGSLRGSTFHIMLTGTEGTNEGEEWSEGWMTAKTTNHRFVIEINWHQNAWQDKDWLERQYERATTPDQKAKVALEYERNYFAGFSDWIYPEAKRIAKLVRGDVEGEPLYTAIDPGRDDFTGALVTQMHQYLGQRGIHILDSFERSLTDTDPEWVAHVFTGIEPTKEDRCYPRTFTADEARIGARFYKWWVNRWELNWFIDPAGKAAQTRASFLVMLEEKSAELRGRRVREIRAELIRRAELGEMSPEEQRAQEGKLPDPFGIACQYLRIEENRQHNQRHYAARKYIPYTSIEAGGTYEQTQRTLRAKKCLVRYQWNPQTPKAVTDQVPLHNAYSHLATCYEYLCIYVYYGFMDPVVGADGRKHEPNAIGPTKKIPHAAPPQSRGVPEHYQRRKPPGPADAPDRGSRVPANYPGAQRSWR